MSEKLRSSNQKQNDLSAQGIKKNDARLTSIRNKMSRGKKLSGSDKGYLRKNAPQLLHKAMNAEKKREDMERRLKNCKSKEEVRRLRSQVTQLAVDPSTILSASYALPDSGSMVSAPGIDSLESVQISASSQTETSFRNDNAVNYTYKAVDEVYRSFKSGGKYRKLPGSIKKNLSGQKLDTKA